MEFSDDEEEEVIDLNENYDNDNNNEKTEKTKSSSTKKIKWIKSSLESLSQMARSGFEETEFSEPNEIIKDFFENQVYDNRNDNDNDEDNKENISDYNNDINENNNNEIKNNNEITEQEKETNMESVPTKNDYTFIWDEGGNTVKLIGSFSNWKQQFPMEKDETNNIFKFTLTLNNEKYQYKYIVDGVWKCSKNQKTIDDGKGNINNILDLTNVKPKEEVKKKNVSKKRSKNENKKKSKTKKKEEKNNKDLRIKKETSKKSKTNDYGNEYPDFTKLTEPNHSEIIGKPFYLNNISKQRKIGNSKYYKFTNNDSYSSSKSYINLSNYRHTILNHITFQKKIKKNKNIKLGISNRYREKATTFIYYNCFSKK